MSRVIVKVPKDRIEQWNKMLSCKTAVEGTKHDEVIEQFDHELFEGETYVIEFKLVNGDAEAGPYLDIILWDDGSEVFVHDAGAERLDREFFVRDSYMAKEFTIVIEPTLAKKSKGANMKSFLVEREERYKQRIRVQAENKEDARARVVDGEGDEVGEPEYVETMYPENWNIEEE